MFGLLKESSGGTPLYFGNRLPGRTYGFRLQAACSKSANLLLIFEPFDLPAVGLLVEFGLFPAEPLFPGHQSGCLRIKFFAALAGPLVELRLLLLDPLELPGQLTAHGLELLALLLQLLVGGLVVFGQPAADAAQRSGQRRRRGIARQLDPKLLGREPDLEGLAMHSFEFIAQRRERCFRLIELFAAAPKAIALGGQFGHGTLLLGLELFALGFGFPLALDSSVAELDLQALCFGLIVAEPLLGLLERPFAVAKRFGLASQSVISGEEFGAGGRGFVLEQFAPGLDGRPTLLDRGEQLFGLLLESGLLRDELLPLVAQ